MDELFLELKDMVYERLDVSCDIPDIQLDQVIDQCILDKSREKLLSIYQKEQLKRQLYNSIKKLDMLQELIEDETITEIMINGYKNIFIERNGRIESWNKCFESTEKLEDIAQKIAALSNRLVNESNPIVDTRLKDGSRVSILLRPIAIDGPIITIRKFYKEPLTIDGLIRLGAISKEAAAFLIKAVKARYNIFISGGTGSGKTTFLNALSDYIPKDERAITIEDSAELQIRGLNNLVRLEARNANVEGDNSVTIRDLIKASLRMRPDRIVVGEIRGAEAIDMLQAMNTGHDGSLSTGHGNSPKDMLSRIATMVLLGGYDIPLDAVQQQITSAIDIIVHLSRMRDKSRKVIEIDEIVSYSRERIELNPLFKFVEEENSEADEVMGKMERLNTQFINTDKMLSCGITEW